MNKQRLVSSAMDCITRFRASGFPLKNIASDIIRARKLNSLERKILLDLIFCFCREIYLINHFFLSRVKFFSSMPAQQKDVLALKMLCEKISDIKQNNEMAEALYEYEKWSKSLGDERYQISLGPLISGILTSDYGENINSIAKGLFSRPAKYLAFDHNYLTADDLSEALYKIKIPHFRHKILKSSIGTYENIDIFSLKKIFGDHIWLMDAGSQIIAEMIKPNSFDFVLDICTGIGNKARYITMNDCNYVAVDIDKRRLNKAKDRLKDRNIDFINADGRKLPIKPNTFNWILLDAPCSGVGVLRRNSDLIHRLTKDSLKKYCELQYELLSSAIELLACNGKLIYATCSLFKQENQQQITRILEENSKLLPLSLSELVGENLICGKKNLNNEITLFPHIFDCDGFYISALTKICSK
jgi:16S rRNA C967 or C1407 C5-methylase (RsmB/RsmF family)